jgi:hypothetical protein
MTYENYLFSQLLALYSPDFAALPYDWQYNDIPILYADFEQSPFNVDNIGLYECIINYLQNKYPQPVNQ